MPGPLSRQLEHVASGAVDLEVTVGEYRCRFDAQCLELLRQSDVLHARVDGRIHRLTAAQAATAADEFAAANPTTDLLDVGRTASLYAITVDRVRIHMSRSIREVPVTDYLAAEPDPLHDVEQDLLRDLADHHAPQVENYFRFLLAISGIACWPNRHGRCG